MSHERLGFELIEKVLKLLKLRGIESSAVCKKGGYGLELASKTLPDERFHQLPLQILAPLLGAIDESAVDQLPRYVPLLEEAIHGLDDSASNVALWLSKQLKQLPYRKTLMLGKKLEEVELELCKGTGRHE